MAATHKRHGKASVLGVSLAMAVGAFLSVAATASAQTTAVTRTPFATEFVNACTGEAILFEGTIVSVNRGGEPPIEGPNGFHFSFQGRGATTSGVRYVLVDVQNAQSTFPVGRPGEPPPPSGPGAQSHTSTGVIQLIRLGNGAPDDDERIFIRQHITHNANGAVTSVRFVSEDFCQ